MATVDEWKTVESVLRSKAKDLADKADELKGMLVRPALGDMSFVDAVDALGRASSLAEVLAKSDLQALSFDQMNNILGALNNLGNSLAAAANFKITQTNADTTRLQIITALNGAADQVCNFALSVVAFISSQDRGQLKKLEADLVEARESYGRLMTEIHEHVKEIDGYKNNAAKAYEAIQKAAGEAGVSKHATEFQVLATQHDTAAWGWLATTVGLGVASVAAVFALVNNYPLADASGGTIAQYIMTRAVAFALASYLTVWAAKNYRAHRHLNVVNMHRHKALLTFETFVNAAKDDATKNAVLLEATRCIFSAGSTGYGSEDGESSPMQLVEIVRNFVDKK